MNNVRFQGRLERGAISDLWRNTLSQIPSVFGRLLYLSSLRSSNTGAYEHHGLALVFGDKESDKALRKSHEQSFSEWLAFSLSQQKSDVDAYLSTVGNNPEAIVNTWLRLTPYRNLMPASARKPERELFLLDFNILLQLLRDEYEVDVPDQDA